MKWLRIAIVAAIVVPAAWVVSASALYCQFAHKMDLFTFPFTQWIQVVPYWRLDHWMTLKVVGAAIIPTVIALCIQVAVLRHIMRKKKQPEIYGRTGWASEDEMIAGGLSIEESVMDA